MVEPVEKYCACPGLASLIQTVESILALPTQTCVNDVAGCLYAIFMSGHKKETRFWDEANHGWWDGAVQGSSALQSALRIRIYEEVATFNGQATVYLYFDLRPCVPAQAHRIGTGAQLHQAAAVHGDANADLRTHPSCKCTEHPPFQHAHSLQHTQYSFRPAKTFQCESVVSLTSLSL